MTTDFQQRYKDTLASWASGVTVVTVNEDGMLYGLTVSSFTSVSLDPPLVSVCLNTSNRLGAMIGRAGRFGVSVLGDDQQKASNYFAGSGREPTRDFVEIDGEWTDHGVPVVAGALAWLVCDVHELVDAGTHVIVLGEVVDATSHEDGRGPLMYWRRGYRMFVADD